MLRSDKFVRRHARIASCLRFPMTNAKAIRQNTAVISNEERNLLFSLRCNEADYSPDEAGFDMTGEEFASRSIMARCHSKK